MPSFGYRVDLLAPPARSREHVPPEQLQRGACAQAVFTTADSGIIAMAGFDILAFASWAERRADRCPDVGPRLVNQAGV